LFFILSFTFLVWEKARKEGIEVSMEEARAAVQNVDQLLKKAKSDDLGTFTSKSVTAQPMKRRRDDAPDYWSDILYVKSSSDREGCVIVSICDHHLSINLYKCDLLITSEDLNQCNFHKQLGTCLLKDDCTIYIEISKLSIRGSERLVSILKNFRQLFDSRITVILSSVDDLPRELSRLTELSLNAACLNMTENKKPKLCYTSADKVKSAVNNKLGESSKVKHKVPVSKADQYDSKYKKLEEEHEAMKLEYSARCRNLEEECKSLERESADSKKKLEEEHSSFKKETEACLKELQEEHEAKYSKLEEQHNAKYSMLEQEHKAIYPNLQQEHEAKYSKLEKEHEARYSKLEEQHDAKYSKLEQEHKARYSKLKQDHEAIYPKLQQEHEGKYSKLEEEYEARYSKLEEQHVAKYSKLEQEHKDRYSRLEQEHESLIQKINSSEKELEELKGENLLLEYKSKSCEADPKSLRGNKAAKDVVKINSEIAKQMKLKIYEVEEKWADAGPCEILKRCFNKFEFSVKFSDKVYSRDMFVCTLKIDGIDDGFEQCMERCWIGKENSKKLAKKNAFISFLKELKD
jgi:myosin heavy subunit